VRCTARFQGRSVLATGWPRRGKTGPGRWRQDQAVLVYRFTCKGKPARDVLLTTDRKGKLLLAFSSKKLKEREVLFTKNWFKIPEPMKPRWMPQVIKTIQAEAPTNPAAQDFLDNVEIGEDGLPVKPEISEDTPKE